MKKLNKQQKEWLFENQYVTAKTLDACVEPGWKNYFIKCFNWELNLDTDPYGFNRLYLKDKKSGEIYYTIGLILTEPTLCKLLST